MESLLLEFAIAGVWVEVQNNKPMVFNLHAFKKSRHGRQSTSVLKRLGSLLRQPFFLWITALGNGAMVFGALFFYHLEDGVNPHIHGFIDALYWSVSVITTVGASYQPITTQGKVLGMCLMLGGSLFLWTYMGLFVGALVEPELSEIESEVFRLKKEINAEQRAEQRAEQKYDDRVLHRIQSLSSELQSLLMDPNPETKSETKKRDEDKN